MRDLRGTKQEAELLEYLGNVEDPTSDQFVHIFARFKDSNPRYYVDDLINIGSNHSKFVKDNSTTTVGLYIINKFLFEPLGIFGYINKPINKDTWESIESNIAKALTAYELSTDQAREFIDKSQYLLGGPLSQLINYSISNDILMLPPGAKKMRKELLKENKEALENNDNKVSSSVERAVVKKAIEELEDKDSPGKSFFDSGAVDPYNNYKTMFVMKGAILDNTGESISGYKVITSNYNDGVTKTDMPKIADSAVRSYYNSGVLTADSGYLTKKYNTVAQQVKIGPIGSDCKTTDYLKIKIEDRHIYRYIVENGKNVLLTQENIDKYKGKVCNLRTPVHCHRAEPEYCNICVGERPYRVGNYNLGLSLMIMTGSTMNAALKTKHDVTVKYHPISTEELTKYIN